MLDVEDPGWGTFQLCTQICQVLPVYCSPVLLAATSHDVSSGCEQNIEPDLPGITLS